MITGKLTERFWGKIWDFDPGVTTPVNVGIVDMADFIRLLVIVRPAVIAAGGPASIKILASAASGFTSPVEIVAHAAPSTMDATGDNRVLEVTKDDLVAAGTDLRYVTCEIDAATATDEFSVLYLMESKTAQAGLTADITT